MALFPILLTLILFSPVAARASTSGDEVAGGSGGQNPWVMENATGCSGSVPLSLAWSSDGRTLAWASEDGYIRFWPLGGRAVMTAVAGDRGPVRCLAWAPSREAVFAGTDSGVAWSWNLTLMGREFTERAHAGRVNSISVSPDARRFATASNDSTIGLWDAATGRAVNVLSGHADRALSVAWSPDGKRLASGSADGTVKLWGAGAGSLIRTLPNIDHPVRSVAWSPDGQRIAAGSSDCRIRIWNATAGTPIRTLGGHVNSVRSVAWSPDGMYIASCSGDRLVKLWSSESGRLLSAFSGHRGAVECLAFSPDGCRLASCSADGTIRLLMKDTDGDNRADSDDAFPDDPTQWSDPDGDGYGDNPEGEFPDSFSQDPTQVTDADGDGHGDNPDGSDADRFPLDPTLWADKDGDGRADHVDALPLDPTQWSDLDGDGRGDNPAGADPDAFPVDRARWLDKDGDGSGGCVHLPDDSGDARVRTTLALAAVAALSATFLPAVRLYRRRHGMRQVPGAAADRAPGEGEKSWVAENPVTDRPAGKNIPWAPAQLVAGRAFPSSVRRLSRLERAAFEAAILGTAAVRPLPRAKPAPAQRPRPLLPMQAALSVDLDPALQAELDRRSRRREIEAVVAGALDACAAVDRECRREDGANVLPRYRNILSRLQRALDEARELGEPVMAEIIAREREGVLLRINRPGGGRAGGAAPVPRRELS